MTNTTVFKWHYPAINLPQAWEITTGTPASGQVIVAVIDWASFLRIQICRQLVSGFDFISDASNSAMGTALMPTPMIRRQCPVKLKQLAWHPVAGTIARH